MHIVFAFILGLFVTLFPVKSESQLWVSHYNPDAEAEFEKNEKAKQVGDGVWCTGRAACSCMACYDMESYITAAEEFEALFNATEVKRAKNGRIMVKGANSNTFKFAPKGV